MLSHLVFTVVVVVVVVDDGGSGGGGGGGFQNTGSLQIPTSCADNLCKPPSASTNVGCLMLIKRFATALCSCKHGVNLIGVE